MNKSGLNLIPFEGLAGGDARRYVYICNMTTGISRWSKEAVEYFDLPDEYMEDAGSIWAEHIHPSDKERYWDDINRVFSGEKNFHNLDYRARNKDGEYVVCTCKGTVVSASTDGEQLFVGTIENHGISDYIDSVTGLYNVYGFLRDIDNYTLKKDTRVTLLAIAINHFADINNMYGYTNANRIISSFCESMRAMAGDFNIYRMDGVKFCIAFENVEDSDIVSVYMKLKRIGHNGYDISNAHTSFTISGGVVYLDENVDLYSVQAGLSYVLDQSKYKRHGELVYLEDKIVAEKSNNLARIDKLRNCVYNYMEGFYMCYQPIIDAKTETIHGMEALLRWRGEPFGEIPPGLFVPWLENDPCFYKLGAWIMRKSLNDAKPIVEEHPDFIVNVNVSVEQIERSGFRRSVCDILEETEFPPENLCMELTERVMSLDIKFLRQELDYFRSMGIKIALDDFGTGVSSLSLLLDLKVDVIKIDRNFILNITTDPKEQLMVKTISDCAEGLGLEICVEGVETEEMKDFLKQYKIQRHQGYYYSKPVVLAEFKKLLR